MLARWIRANSPRAEAPFVTVNCPALSGDLMTSALFGHRKGAFTGAIADVAGKVQEAESGTLLLDEVGELTADAQARLLRFLNDRTYERLGEARERQADVRLIAATNRDLEAEVRAGRFREDLFYRLNVVTLTLPRFASVPRMSCSSHIITCRSSAGSSGGRPEVLGAPSRRCAAHLAGKSPRAAKRGRARGHSRRPARCSNRPISAACPPRRSLRRGSSGPSQIGAPVSIEALEREHIARVIAQSPSLEAAARMLDIDATTLQRKRKRYGLA